MTCNMPVMLTLQGKVQMSLPGLTMGRVSLAACAHTTAAAGVQRTKYASKTMHTCLSTSIASAAVVHFGLLTFFKETTFLQVCLQVLHWSATR